MRRRRPDGSTTTLSPRADFSRVSARRRQRRECARSCRAPRIDCCSIGRASERLHGPLPGEMVRTSLPEAGSAMPDRFMRLGPDHESHLAGSARRNGAAVSSAVFTNGAGSFPFCTAISRTREEARTGRTARPSGSTVMVVRSGICGKLASLSGRVPSGANRTTSTGRSTILA